MFALLESVLNLLQNPYDITHLTLGMLLQYFGKLKSTCFLQLTIAKLTTLKNSPVFGPPCTLLYVMHFCCFCTLYRFHNKTQSSAYGG